MDMQMGKMRRMMHKMSRKAERMWNRITGKLDLR